MKRTKLHALNPQSARKRIKAAKSNKPFMTALLDRDHRGHRNAVEQWTRLHAAAFPESARAQSDPVPHKTRPPTLRGFRESAGASGGETAVNGRRANRNARLRRPMVNRSAKQAGPAIEEQDDWTEHWFAKGRHFYDRISPPICAASECSLEDVVEALNGVGVHPNQTEEFVPGQPYVGDVDLPGPFGRDDVSTSAIFDDGVQVGVRNETQENHKLHPGTVERTVILKDGTYRIRTQGEGTGSLGGPNILFDDVVWGQVDRRVIDAFR